MAIPMPFRVLRARTGVTHLILVFLGAGTASVGAQGTGGTPSGRLLEAKPWRALAAYEALDTTRQQTIAREDYEDARAHPAFRIEAIRYTSDGLEVPGVWVRPRDPGPRRWPVIIFNRGGNGDFGRIGDVLAIEMYLLAREGFVVVGSDYRYHGPTAMADTWGGVEVNDIMNLVPLIAAIPEADTSRMYMVGASRGGTMAFLALKQGLPVRAAAVWSGVTDLEDWGRYRPELINGNEVTYGWARNWPDFATRAAEHHRARSAIYWPDSVRVPVLLLASRTDPLVHADQALRMAVALQRANRPYALQVYDDDNHGLTRNRHDRIRRIVDWFTQH